MNRERYYSVLTDPESTAGDRPEDVQAEHSRRKNVFRKLGSYRIEIVIETFLILACMVLGVAFQFKVMLTVSLFCVAAAIPDFVTAILVRQNDSDPRHGKALMYFFIASGFLRTASLGVGVFVFSMLAFVFFPFVGGLADVGAITGLLVTMGVFIVVFPITFAGVLYGYSLPGGVFFCRELTKLRRKGEHSDIDDDSLNPSGSLKILAAGSAISAAVFSLATVFLAVAVLNPGNQMTETTRLVLIGVVLAQLVIPLTWYAFLCVKFAEPWQVPKLLGEDPIEPLRTDEVRFLNEWFSGIPHAILPILRPYVTRM